MLWSWAGRSRSGTQLGSPRPIGSAPRDENEVTGRRDEPVDEVTITLSQLACYTICNPWPVPCRPVPARPLPCSALRPLVFPRHCPCFCTRHSAIATLAPALLPPPHPLFCTPAPLRPPSSHSGEERGKEGELGRRFIVGRVLIVYVTLVCGWRRCWEVARIVVLFFEWDGLVENTRVVFLGRVVYPSSVTSFCERLGALYCWRAE